MNTQTQQIGTQEPVGGILSEQETTALPVSAEQSDSSASAFSLVMDDGAMDRIMSAAKLMASAKVTIPKHLQNSEGDCMAVIMQAAQWKMNPFAVAQKTHMSQSGTLGYEAQLVNAVIVSSGAIVGQPEFEFFGDWGKILGKVKEMRGQSGGKYYVSNWEEKDEEGLGVVVTAYLRGESTPRRLEVLLTQCWPRFSTQWATDPQQQITYAAVRKFGRRYAPGAILGVYTPEELDDGTIRDEKNITPQRQNGAKVAAAAQAQSTTDSEERQSLIGELEEVAKNYGLSAYEEKFMAIGKAKRTMIGADEHERLKKIASSIPSTATVVADQTPAEQGDQQ